MPAYIYSICICNPFETHLCNVRNMFVICVLHIRRVKVWFLCCKSMVFGVQKGGFLHYKSMVFAMQKWGFYFLTSALLQCCDVLAAFYSMYFSVAITILVFPRCVRFVSPLLSETCCLSYRSCLLNFVFLFVPHGQ